MPLKLLKWLESKKICLILFRINNIDELNNYLKKYKPLINQYLLPEKEDKSQIKNRRKFSPSDDKFLLQGLNEYGYK